MLPEWKACVGATRDRARTDYDEENRIAKGKNPSRLRLRLDSKSLGGDWIDLSKIPPDWIGEPYGFCFMVGCCSWDLVTLGRL